MFLKLPFTVSFSVLFFTIQYAVFRKSFRTFYVSICIYVYMQLYVYALCMNIYKHIW